MNGNEAVSLSWEAVRGLLITRGSRIVIILIAALVAYRVVKFVVHRLEKSVEDEDPTTRSEAEKRAETLGRIIRQVSLVAIFVTSGLVVMRELGFDVAPLIAGAGIAGIAIGFGAQNLVRDLITGFFLLLENQLRVGDVVEIAGKSGLVEAVNLRTTVLRDLDGNVHIVPNGNIDTVTNRTLEWSRAVVDVGVAYKENVDRVMAVLEDIGREMAADPAWETKILEPLAVLGVNAFSPSSVDVRIAFKTRPQEQWAVGRELRRRIKNRFDAEGIEIPFPHVKVIEGGRKGSSVEVSGGPGPAAS